MFTFCRSCDLKAKAFAVDSNPTHQNLLEVLRLLYPKRARLTDAQLYNGLLAANDEVFNELYREVLPQAKKILTNRSCPEAEVDDIFQEALVALWQNARDGRFVLQANTKVSSYLVQLCLNKWIDRTRRVAYRQTDTNAELPEKIIDDQANFEADEQLELQYAQLDQAFTQLGERCREMLSQYYFGKEKLATIADKRGITEASAKTEKYRCMQRLKTLCQSHELPKLSNHVK